MVGQGNPNGLLCFAAARMRMASSPVCLAVVEVNGKPLLPTTSIARRLGVFLVERGNGGNPKGPKSVKTLGQVWQCDVVSSLQGSLDFRLPRPRKGSPSAGKGDV